MSPLLKALGYGSVAFLFGTVVPPAAAAIAIVLWLICLVGYARVAF